MGSSRAVAIQPAAWIAALGMGCATAEPPAAAPAGELTPAPEGVLYSFGYSLGETVAIHDLDEEELERLLAGMRDRARGREPRYGAVESFTRQIGAFFQQRKNEIADREAARAEPFLAEQARAEGAETTGTGAIVTVIERGEGEAPGPGRMVELRYHGALRDGSLVRKSAPGRPLLTSFERLNVCWKEAITRVAPGGSLRVVCPAGTSVPRRGRIGVAPPGAVVIWQLELLDVRESPS